jgi:hypothetical protein
MITFDQARALACDALSTFSSKESLGDVIIVEEEIIETEFAWYFPYDGRTFVLDGDMSSALAGNVPIKVGRDDGAVSFEVPPQGFRFEQEGRADD